MGIVRTTDGYAGPRMNMSVPKHIFLKNTHHKFRHDPWFGIAIRGSKQIHHFPTVIADQELLISLRRCPHRLTAEAVNNSSENSGFMVK